VALVAMLLLAMTAAIFFGFAIATLLSPDFLHRLRERRRRATPAMLRIIKIGNSVVASAGILACFCLIAGIYLDLQLNASFDQRLTILAPVVPEATIRTLKADWAKMGSRADYLRITSSLDRLAAEKGIVLPEIPLS
jgi:hypothetical protein